MWEFGCVICELPEANNPYDLIDEPTQFCIDLWPVFFSVRPYRRLHQCWVIWMSIWPIFLWHQKLPSFYAVDQLWQRSWLCKIYLIICINYSVHVLLSSLICRLSCFALYMDITLFVYLTIYNLCTSGLHRCEAVVRNSDDPH